jgi:hypothetical protein
VIKELRPRLTFPRTVPLDELVTCPVCKTADRIEKASSVVRRSSGQFFDQGTGSWHDFETQLATDLALSPEPEQPSLVKLTIGILVALAFGMAFMGIFAFFETQTYVEIAKKPLELGSTVALTWFAGVIPLAAALRYFLGCRSAAMKYPAWLRARERWERLYYCFRDDIVFLPEEGVTEAAAAMDALLYRPLIVPSPPQPRPEVLLPGASPQPSSESI